MLTNKINTAPLHPVNKHLSNFFTVTKCTTIINYMKKYEKHQFKCPLGDCIFVNNNIYVGLTSPTLLRRCTMPLTDTSSRAQHLKKTFMPNNRITENSYRKQIRTSK